LAENQGFAFWVTQTASAVVLNWHYYVVLAVCVTPMDTEIHTAVESIHLDVPTSAWTIPRATISFHLVEFATQFHRRVSMQTVQFCMLKLHGTATA